MPPLTGVLRLTVVGAAGLPLPDVLGNRLKQIDPYCVLSIDEVAVARTTAKPATQAPVWNEQFETTTLRGRVLEIGIFHKELVGEGRFVASVVVPLPECFEENTADVDLTVRAGAAGGLDRKKKNLSH